MCQLNKRGRQVGADGEKSRKLLLEIAAQQFALHGFHKTKISEIVKEANVTQPTFYLYFKSKDAVFQELIQVFKEKLYNHVAQSKLPTDVAKEGLLSRIAYGLSRLFEFFKQNENVARIGFVVSEEAKDIKVQMALKIEENLIEEVENGYFTTDINLNLVATTMVGAIEHLSITKLWTGVHSPEELAQDFTSLFLCGLKNN
ncbi:MULTISPECIES: TetR/AcrR family transcriptional regulator [Sporosarcina]|uniref:TetR/AcrR family transcriptional regulator n=1 Tax=Sporosarcina TaxID=1569 RepID=UPI000A19BFC1|nr:MULTISPECIES: TetR/AcrR family transcriptional regulator [Sporosarcina]PIC73408.1 TetR/AcrR family transcriptional regulator [Sporosarcina sp. P17b]